MKKEKEQKNIPVDNTIFNRLLDIKIVIDENGKVSKVYTWKEVMIILLDMYEESIYEKEGEE